MGLVTVAANAVQCQPVKVLHKPTGNGHDRTRQIWEENHGGGCFWTKRRIYAGSATRQFRAGIHPFPGPVLAGGHSINKNLLQLIRL
jgi:hypothetical protein